LESNEERGRVLSRAGRCTPRGPALFRTSLSEAALAFAYGRRWQFKASPTRPWGRRGLQGVLPLGSANARSSRDLKPVEAQRAQPHSLVMQQHNQDDERDRNSK
jgi:hypothetical protein